MKRKEAFTLVELLVVIAIISVLAAMLLPTLGNAIATARLTACMNNQKQIAVAVQYYGDDQNGYMVCGFYGNGGTMKPWLKTYNHMYEWHSAGNSDPFILGQYVGNDDLQAYHGRVSLSSAFSCPGREGRYQWQSSSYASSQANNPGIYETSWNKLHRLTAFRKSSKTLLYVDSVGGTSPLLPSGGVNKVYYDDATAPGGNDVAVLARHNKKTSISLLDGHVESLPGVDVILRRDANELIVKGPNQ